MKERLRRNVVPDAEGGGSANKMLLSAQSR
jgi:hypothetical protein